MAAKADIIGFIGKVPSVSSAIINTEPINNMESNQKQLYEAPETLEIEVRMEGFVAASGESTEKYSVYGTAYDDTYFD